MVVVVVVVVVAVGVCADAGDTAFDYQGGVGRAPRATICRLLGIPVTASGRLAYVSMPIYQFS